MTEFRLPGDPKKESLVSSIIRVDQAGEFGAKRIYQGQLSVLKGHEEISHMLEQELVHLNYFEEELRHRKIRPTLLTPIWNKLGFLLGAGTAMLGEKGAMACTVAVEEVIGDHYNSQLKKLENHPDENELSKKISKFKDEELEHRNTGIEFDAEKTPGYTILSKFIKTASKFAIFLSKRI